jgi:hypothetical protein
MRVALALVLLAGCATAPTDDSEAESAPPQALGKADGPQFTGIYQSHTTHHYNGDIPAIELRTDGHYVRERCYRASCALPVPETDTYDVYTSSSGKSYVRFYAQDIQVDASMNLTNEPVVTDVYEIRAFSKGIQLRKAYSTRWQSLYLSSPGLACASSGGAWTTDCACPLNQPGTWPVQVFVPGAGGCIATPGANEGNCDDSHGMWTDDDATLVGSYCICTQGEYLTADGGCAAI